MKIWIFITDDSNGIQARPFATEDAAEAAALAWCKRHWPSDARCPDDWMVAYQEFECSNDAMWIEQHDVPNTEAIIAIQASARAQIDDLLVQVYQMKGLFDDADGSIARAIADAEVWPDLVDTKNGEGTHA
ncbi:hypothetical protein [Yoonia sp. R2-816]|uniref:hypothetical protein n=1 Tax=Yoonia sp. R2-816 TaxID=3342638 RepID=UPI00372A3614